MNPSRPAGAGAGAESRIRSTYPKSEDSTSTFQSSEGHTSAPLQPSLGEGEEVSQTTASLTADFKEAAKTTKRAVQEQASELMSQVGHELSKTAEDQKLHGVEAIDGFTHAINTAAAELEHQSPLVAQYAREAAGKIEEFSGNIRNRNVGELLQAATDLARSQPALFFGGAVVAGFALSRFLKSSAKHTSGAPSSGPSTHHSGYSTPSSDARSSYPARTAGAQSSSSDPTGSVRW